MTLRLPLSGKSHTTIVSAYAPTMTSPDEFKDKFYDDLDSVISAAPRTDKLILVVDFNARVGTDHQNWEGVIGSEGVGKCNSNGLLLFKEVCRAWITDHQHNLLSYNLQKDIMDAPSHQTLPSHWLCHSAKEGRTGCQSYKDYVWCTLLNRLVVSKLNLRIQPMWRPQGKKVPKKLGVSKLKQDSKRQAFVNDLCSRLDALEHSSEDVDESWAVFRDTVNSSAMDSLGPVSRKHQDWFDENGKEIQGLLEEKHQKHKAYLRNNSSVSSKTAYSNICKTVQTRLRDMQDSWLSRKKADEI